MYKYGNLAVLFRAQRAKLLPTLGQDSPVAENADEKLAKWSLKHIC